MALRRLLFNRAPTKAGGGGKRVVRQALTLPDFAEVELAAGGEQDDDAVEVGKDDVASLKALNPAPALDDPHGSTASTFLVTEAHGQRW
jgi:hypothetical protein